MTTPIGIGVVTPSAPAAATTAPAAAASATDPQVAQAAKELEGVFLNLLVKEMFAGTQLEEAGSVYSGLMTEQLAGSLSDAGGLGLADSIERDLGA